MQERRASKKKKTKKPAVIPAADAEADEEAVTKALEQVEATLNAPKTRHTVSNLISHTLL